MTATRIPPGWNTTGKKISDPIAFVESIVEPIIQQTPRLDSRVPTYTQTKNENHSDILSFDATRSVYDYEEIPSFGLTRISADGDSNNCWFDSFLFCMSPSYRALSIMNRKSIRNHFRKWCAENVKTIYESVPSVIRSSVEFSDIDQPLLEVDFKNPKKEIDTLEGFMIAWFFGVNCIVFATPGMHPDVSESNEYEPICETMFQSPNCKVICMAFSGNHYEPLVRATFSGTSLLEKDTTTLFSWNDPQLCKPIQKALSRCNQAEFGIMKEYPWKVTCATSGGRRRRSAHVRSAHHKGSRSAHRKTRLIKRRRTTARASRTRRSSRQ